MTPSILYQDYQNLPERCNAHISSHDSLPSASLDHWGRLQVASLPHCTLADKALFVLRIFVTCPLADQAMCVRQVVHLTCTKGTMEWDYGSPPSTSMHTKGNLRRNVRLRARGTGARSIYSNESFVETGIGVCLHTCPQYLRRENASLASHVTVHNN